MFLLYKRDQTTKVKMHASVRPTQFAVNRLYM